MKIYAPDYYKNFRCLAGECKHSCCKGWEVDIDEDTLKYYQTVEGEMGQRLKNAISYENIPHFAMTKEGNCPFLNECGLCDIMINLGFDKVSYICDEHPRFYNFYSDRQEVGLGLSCEAVAALILAKKDKTQLVCAEDEGSELLWEDECDFLDLRDDVFDILQNREKPIAERIKEMLDFAGVELPQKSLRQWAEIFLSLERLDDKWTDILQDVKKAASLPQTGEEWFETALEQLAVYFVYRHMTDGFDNGDISGGLAFAAVSVGFIGAVCRACYGANGSFTIEDMGEICRMYSGEIEYSQENVQRLIDIFKI